MSLRGSMKIDRPAVYAPFLFLLLFAILLAREYALVREEALTDATTHATELTTVLSSEVGGELAGLLRSPQEPAALARIDAAVAPRLKIFHFASVKIYDTEGRILYSDREGVRGTRVDLDDEMREAARGGTVAGFISRSEYLREYGDQVEKAMIEVYAPLKTGNGATGFIFETYFDYTAFVERGKRRLLGSAASLAVVLGLSVALVTFLRERLRTLEKKVEDLRLLTICSYCKNIRVSESGAEPEEWQRIERYFGFRDNVDFSHGICPTCCERLFPEVSADLKKRNG